MTRLLLILLLAFTASEAAGQKQDTLRSRLLRAHRANNFVRLRLDDGAVVQGRIPFVRDSSVSIAGRRIDYLSITEAQLRIPAPTRGPGGALTGALSGSLIGLGLSALCYGDTSCRFGITGFFAGIGAAAGFVIGHAFKTGAIEWRPLWP